MEFAFPYRRMILSLYFLGLLTYFLGSSTGFCQLYLLYLLYSFESTSYYLAPILIFEFYPRFVLIMSTAEPLIFYEKFSIISTIFSVAAFTAILFTFFNKTMLALIISILASLTLITHYGLIGYLMGFEPTGFEISITYGIPSPQYYFYLGFFIKNLLSILLATTMYVIGMNLLFFKVFQQKVELISLIPGIREKFQKFKSIHRATIVPFVMIHLVVALHGLDYWLISQEFPYYNPTALNGFVLVPYAFIFYFILISIPAILEEKAYRQSRQILAEVITPLLEKELVNNKPLIQIWNFKNELGLESVDRKDFRLVLKNSLKMIEMKENIHFGFLINYFYIVEPLVDIAREKIGRDGQADIEEIANEITVHWANLKEAYKKIKKEKLFENVKIVRGKILPIYHGTSI